MQPPQPIDPLRIGLLGSGFAAGFHLQALEAVRHVQVGGVHSRTPANRDRMVADANRLGLGPCRGYDSLEQLVADTHIDAVWMLGPNFRRLDDMRAIARIARQRERPLLGVACEKPLARTLAEGRQMLRLVEDAGLRHGYLENQVFATAVQRGKDVIWRRAVPATGRPYLARAAEEHSGPHRPWFWQGNLQGGGVLLDMMCHSIEVARFLLTAPDQTRSSVTPVRANGTVAQLKWTRTEYVRELQARMGPEVDYALRPSEDFARGVVTLRDELGQELIIEATTSWAYVGPGLRIQVELIGPEYALEISTLNTPLKIFLSRAVRGSAGEDLVEKQNAEQGLMPVVEDEAASYGYTAENRHMVEAFRRGEAPIETFADGVGVLEILMALYRSAELGRTVELPSQELETYVPAVARSGAEGPP